MNGKAVRPGYCRVFLEYLRSLPKRNAVALTMRKFLKSTNALISRPAPRARSPRRRHRLPPWPLRFVAWVLIALELFVPCNSQVLIAAERLRFPCRYQERRRKSEIGHPVCRGARHPTRRISVRASLPLARSELPIRAAEWRPLWQPR